MMKHNNQSLLTHETEEQEEQHCCSDEFISDFAVYLPEINSGTNQNQETNIPNHYW